MDPKEAYSLKVTHLSRDGLSERELSFPLEAPVSIYVDSRLLATMSATPSKLQALAAGYLLGEGLIKGKGDLRSIEASALAERGQVWVTLAEGTPLKERAPTLTSGCGRGVSFLCVSDIDSMRPLPPGPLFRAALMARGMRALKDGSELRNSAGAVHSAMLMTPQGACGAVAEDIGRHNAVDKAVGAALLLGEELPGRALLTSGRISSELVMKAAILGCPVVASARGATHLALEAAKKLGATLAVYVRGDSLDVCTHPERIDFSPEPGSEGSRS